MSLKGFPVAAGMFWGPFHLFLSIESTRQFSTNQPSLSYGQKQQTFETPDQISTPSFHAWLINDKEGGKQQQLSPECTLHVLAASHPWLSLTKSQDWQSKLKGTQITYLKKKTTVVIVVSQLMRINAPSSMVLYLYNYTCVDIYIIKHVYKYIYIFILCR